MIPFCDLKRAVEETAGLKHRIKKSITRVMESGVFLGGPEVEAFEREWAQYCGQKYCVSCSSGMAALSLFPVNGFIVRIPANTLEATRSGIEQAGGIVECSDVDSCGFAKDRMDALDVSVLLYGRLAPGKVWFDACQAHGWKPAEQCNVAWSFYPTKNLGGFGDSGAATTNDGRVYDRMLEKRKSIGARGRMDEIQAAVLRAKMPHLDEWNNQRRLIALRYWEMLEGAPHLRCVVKPDQGNHHMFPILCERRKELHEFLEVAGVETKVRYPTPLADLPGARKWCDSVLCLPIYPGLTVKEHKHVCRAVRYFCEQQRCD